MLPEDGCSTDTCRSNFNVNFNVLLSKYIVHPLVKIKKDFDNSILFEIHIVSAYV